MFTQLILPPPSDKGQRDPHTPLPLLCMVASVCGLWVQCGHLETTQAVRLKSGSSRTLPQFLNLPGCGENCIRKFQHEGGGMLYWPACWVAYKRKSWRAGLQSAASDGQRHTPCGHNLNYTIWTLYAESVSSHQVPFTPGCSSFTQGHTLLPGACPFQSIKQL